MLLRKVHGPLVGDTQIGRELADKKHSQPRVGMDEHVYNRHGDGTDRRQIAGRSAGQVTLLREISPVSKVLDGAYHADNLATSAHTFLGDFDLPLEQTHHLFRFVAFGVNDLVALIVRND